MQIISQLYWLKNASSTKDRVHPSVHSTDTINIAKIKELFYVDRLFNIEVTMQLIVVLYSILLLTHHFIVPFLYH